MYKASDLNEILSFPTPQMVDTINKLPKGAKESIKGIASTLIESHMLDSVHKIKALDDIFGTKMLLTLVQE